MSWRLLADKDVRDAIRQYHLHASVLAFVVLCAGTAYVATETFGPGTGVSPDAVPSALAVLSSFLVPLVAVGFAQDVIVGMRTRGDLKLLLGMPFTRGDLVVGTFVGRIVLVWASILAGVVVATALAFGRGAPVATDALLFVTGMTGVLGAVFVAIGVGISASVSTGTRAGGLAIGAFFLFVFQLWSVLPRVALWVASGFRLPRETPEWVSFVTHLNPVLALWNVLSTALPDVGTFVGSLPASPPVYRTVPFAVLVLAAWIVLPMAVGYRRFERTDL